MGMNIKKFENYNKFNALLVFFIALTTYYLTVEPTASYWDCAEYISTSAKLQVGHPPGAPFFQMIGAFFASFASNPEDIAFMVNMMSVFASAFTILFLFLTTSIIGKKILKISKTITKTDSIKILSGSTLAALSFTFSDSFWFNAVEAEVFGLMQLKQKFMQWLHA